MISAPFAIASDEPDQAQRDLHLAAHQECNKRRDIGGQVHDLRVARGTDEVLPEKSCER